MSEYDLIVVGGGVNGCGIARDAAGRGLRVLLCERGDLASSTSSASTKLIHGGLRYLEHGDFRLVRESLRERERLLRIAPHIIRPMRFILPHRRGMRPRWLMRLGLLLYDHLGGRSALSPTRKIDLAADPAGAPLREGEIAYEYSDCCVDDARLVVLNALDAAERGADIRTYSKCISMRREGGMWRVRIQSRGGEYEASSRALVNAAGLWVGDVRAAALGARAAGGRRMRMVRGSHIVLPRLFDGARAYILQNDDRRVIFAIPYQRDYTLIGTTECTHDGARDAVAISDDEIDYLLRAVGRFFHAPPSGIGRDAIVWTYSGVRPLFDGGDGDGNLSAITRDYAIEFDADLALLNVFGGKITTYRQLSEKAVDHLAALLGGGARWTADAALPGGDFARCDADAIAAKLRAACDGMGVALSRRLARGYGTRAFEVIGDAARLADLGAHFGAGLHQREVAYLIEREWARTPADVLWRRSKIGLHLDAAGQASLARWMAQWLGERAAANPR